ncbi:MAG: outer membrane beta-barrel protein, partial [Candidatus Omnitrophica bacterium]|nr:outer membrane beta-barrel protein [Candidatus Omnitrophota bacterium]
DNIFADIEGEMTVDASKNIDVILKNAYTHSKEPRSMSGNLGAVTGRFTYDTNILSVMIKARQNKIAVIEFEGFNRIQMISTDIFEDSILSSCKTKLDMVINETTNFLLGHKYKNRFFEEGEYYSSNIVFAGVIYALSKSSTVDIEAGYENISTFSRKILGESYMGLNFEKRFNKDLFAKIFVVKENGSTDFEKSTYNYWNFSGELKKVFNSKLTGKSMCYFEKGKFTEIPEEQTVIGLDLGLEYLIEKDISVYMSYGYSGLSSKIGSEFMKNKIELGLKMSF